MYKLSHSHFSIAANFEGDRSGFFLGGQKDSLDIFKGGGAQKIFGGGGGKCPMKPCQYIDRFHCSVASKRGIP